MEQKYSVSLVIDSDDINIKIKILGREDVLVDEGFTIHDFDLKKTLSKFHEQFPVTGKESVFFLGGQLIVGIDNLLSTIFTILIPLFNTNKNLNKDISSERVLVVDDDDMVRAVIETCLTRKGMKVSTASDPVEALKILSHYPNDYITLITDYHMPKVNGLEFIQLLTTSELRFKSIIISTGLVCVDETMNALLGSNTNIRTLIKPFTEEELLEAVAD